MRSLVVAACAAALVFGLSSCSEDEPGPVEPTTAPTTSAPPPSPAPKIPEAAQKNTPSGVSTFVRHYIRLLGHAANTGDVAELQRLSASDCEGCTRYIDYFVDTYRKGGYLRQKWTAPGGSMVRHQPRPTLESFVTTRVRISKGQHKQSADEPLENTSGSRDKVTFALRFADGWTVTQIWAGDFE